MICQMCGQEYFRKPHDTNSKYCAQCRPLNLRQHARRGAQIKKLRQLAHIRFQIEWAQWKRDFALGKTQSNLEMMN